MPSAFPFLWVPHRVRKAQQPLFLLHSSSEVGLNTTTDSPKESPLHCWEVDVFHVVLYLYMYVETGVSERVAGRDFHWMRGFSPRSLFSPKSLSSFTSSWWVSYSFFFLPFPQTPSSIPFVFSTPTFPLPCIEMYLTPTPPHPSLNTILKCL